MKPLVPIAALLVAVAFLAHPDADAMFIRTGEPVPVKRLLANLDSWLETHPEDAHAHYVLARVHAMLYAREVDALHLTGPSKEVGEKPAYGFPPWESVLVKRGAGKLTESARGHLLASVRHYQRSVQLDGEIALAQLALGWMLENGSRLAAVLDEPPGIDEAKLTGETIERIRGLVRQLGDGDATKRDAAQAALVKELPLAIPHLVGARNDTEDLEVRTRLNRVLARAWEDLAVASYRKAFALAVETDRKKEYFGPHADSGVAFEAGEGILRILGDRELGEKEKAELATIREDVETFRSKGRAITPVIFPLRGEGRLADLVDPARLVTFDLDGDDRPERLGWVKPGAGILVWDPERTGRITSGRQLFGSATWWIAWENGFEPLAALDDDGDGALTGDELDGIAVWTDRDGDAVSDPGEVVPAREAGIAALVVRGITTLEGVPAHPRGIVMRDGSTRPAYDWTVEVRGDR